MVRTRFAPSPTGYLHIGGVRTAFFNWLFARKHGGQFILRIDDTDQQRNVAESLAPILHGFRWLGLDWDEGAEVGGPCGPYYQSQKTEHYQAAVRELIEKGHAYWDYGSTEEIKAEREAAEKEKRPFLYSRRWMAESSSARAKFEGEGRQGVVRLKMPREGKCQFTDHIRGNVEVAWSSEQDHVIQRTDGSVLYNLASVVDDFDMKISHVIRAEEHLSNTPRQIFALEGLGYPRPEYAHVPFVAEPGSKNKLSKRKISQYLKNSEFERLYNRGLDIATNQHKQIAHVLAHYPTSDLAARRAVIAQHVKNLKSWVESPRNTNIEWNETTRVTLDLLSENVEALLNDPGFLNVHDHGRRIQDGLTSRPPAEAFNPVLVEFYEQVGYLPDAILNYLMLLGWAHEDGKTEFFTRREMMDLFTLERVNKGSASFDAKKLFAFQEHYMTALPVEEKVKLVTPYLQRAGLIGDSVPEIVSQIVTHAGPRLVVAGDILSFDDFFLPDDQVRYDEKAFEKHVKKSPDLLKKLRDALAATEPFDAATLKKKVEDVATGEGTKIGPASQLLRVAVTGKEVGFGTFETLAIVGKEQCLFRIERGAVSNIGLILRPEISENKC